MKQNGGGLLRYPIIILLISALVISVAFAQTEEEITPPPVDEITPEEPEEAVSQLDVDESSEPVSEYSYFEDTSDLIPDDPSIVLEVFYEALKSGDGESVAFFVSSEALDDIDVSLMILKESIDRDEELTMNRLIAAGYTATASEIDDWSALDYLKNTVSLPMMSARYSMYEMQIGEYTIGDDDLVIPLTFFSSAGLELPFEVKLTREDDSWKVSTFMGFSSFP